MFCARLITISSTSATENQSNDESVSILVLNPADHRNIVGNVLEASAKDIKHALQAATAYAVDRQTTVLAERTGILLRAADLFEKNQFEFIALAIREAGKSLPKGIAEVRKAVDFLRYYAAQIRLA